MQFFLGFLTIIQHYKGSIGPPLRTFHEGIILQDRLAAHLVEGERVQSCGAVVLFLFCAVRTQQCFVVSVVRINIALR